jgi:hypothetical protein
MRGGDRQGEERVRIDGYRNIGKKTMGHLSAVSTAEIHQGFDAIDRAATIADVVASIAVRGNDGIPGVGVISNYAVSAATETALRIAAAMGFRAHRVAVTSALGQVITDSPEGGDMITEFLGELDQPGATFHVIEADQADDADRRAARMTAVIAAKRPEGARTSVLIVTRGDADDMMMSIARALRMDPDDIVVRIF